MDIRALNYFLQVVKDRNITKAAETLFITQPALSKAIKNLENELGVRLLIKTSRGVEPTDCGIQLAESAAPLINAFNHITEQLHDLSELKKGQVSIGVGPTFGFAYMCDILSSFQELYPNIDVKIHIVSAKQIKAMLNNYELDLGIFNDPMHNNGNENYEYTPIYQDTMALVCNEDHPLSKQHCVDFANLHNESFNLYTEEFALHTMILQHCHNAGFEPKINFLCNAIEILLDLTASGNGICILPRPYAVKIMTCFPKNRIISFAPSIPWVSSLVRRKGAYQSYSSLALGSFIQHYFSSVPPATKNF